jgi:hypothetical protein
VLARETADSLEITSPEIGVLRLRKADIKEQQRGPSAMPENLRDFLTRRELRNLVEFLAQSKDEPSAGAKQP